MESSHGALHRSAVVEGIDVFHEDAELFHRQSRLVNKDVAKNGLIDLSRLFLRSFGLLLFNLSISYGNHTRRFAQATGVPYIY